MKKLLFLILFILCRISISAQNEVGIECNYKIIVQDFTLEELNKITNDQNIKDNIIKRIAEAKKREFVLKGNLDSAFFYEKERMKSDANDDKRQSVITDSYYYSLRGRSVAMATFLGQQLYVKLDNDKYDWQISTEIKKIDGYMCYKATGIHSIDDFRGKKKYNLIAWFCPELPYNYGPAGFFGLPGLVFEAHYENAKEKYVLQSIKFSADLTIQSVGSNKFIDEKEFTTIFNKMMEDMGN
jgi:GLPGLI family protein